MHLPSTYVILFHDKDHESLRYSLGCQRKIYEFELKNVNNERDCKLLEFLKKIWPHLGRCVRKVFCRKWNN